MPKLIKSIVIILALCVLPLCASAAAKYKLEVDLVNQIVTAKDASTGAIVRRMICSSGLGNTTPTGTFTMPASVTPERVGWYYFTKYDTYAKYASRIRGPILFHSVLYSSKSDSRMVVGSWYNLGNKASHGCIRLLPQDALWIANNCPGGTSVKIFASGQPNPLLIRSLKPGEPPDANGITPYGYLRIGVGRSDVGKLQTRLKELGYYSGTIDYLYGAKTDVAVRSFQLAAGLKVDGIAGPATQKAVYAIAAPKYSQSRNIPAAVAIAPTQAPVKASTPAPRATKAPIAADPMAEEEIETAEEIEELSIEPAKIVLPSIIELPEAQFP